MSSTNKLSDLTVISGGQTGVDRAALDAALDAGFKVGGWCPAGRRAEDGPIPDRYPLTETKSKQYRVRTRLNVRDGEATLIICEGEPTGGTALTVKFCQKLNKPFLVVSPSDSVDTTITWIKENDVKVLNVAGPRERDNVPVYKDAKAWLAGLFRS